MLEQEEGKVKDLTAHFLNRKDENDQLTEIASNCDRMKNAGDQQVVTARNELSKLSRNWSGPWAMEWKWSRPSATEWKCAGPRASEWSREATSGMWKRPTNMGYWPAQEELIRGAGK